MNSSFRGTMIAEERYRNLVTSHFQQYPVLYIDLKVGASPACTTNF